MNVESMEGKTVVVTGANSGIGKETAVALAAAGATVVMLCRSRERGEAALGEVRERSGSDRVQLILADLSDPDSLREFDRQFRESHDRLDVLVNNAGVYLADKRTDARGWELTWSINHFGTFHLTQLLYDLLAKSAPARVITVSSMGHRIGKIDFDDPFCDRRKFRDLTVYGSTKLANVLFAKELARRATRHGVESFSLHPGMISTNLTGRNDGMVALGSKLSDPFLLSPAKGAATQIWLASASELPGESGSYYANRKQRRASRRARDPELAARLWGWSLEKLRIEDATNG